MLKRRTVLAKLMAAVMTPMVLATVFASCATLQQDIIRFSETEIEYIETYEQTLVQLDSRSFQGDVYGTFQNECKDYINTLQRQITTMGMNNAVLSRLYALQGRAYLLSGKKSKAQECYKKSVKAYKGDAQSIILSYRLGETKDLDDANIVSICNNKALLTLEKALTLYAQGELGKSAALFDDAFLSLDSIYVESYGTLRNIAWDLRDIGYITQTKSIQKLLTQKRLTVGQFLLLAQDITDLLNPYTQGKTLKESDLYKKAVSNYILTSVSGADGTSVVSKDQVVNRIICARIIWNLYTSEKGSNPLKYSDTFRTMNIPSPVADVELDDKDFDAVLGCIENEIINMKDGVYFKGQDVPTAMEVCKMLQVADK